jgi:hypothetical protein
MTWMELAQKRISSKASTRKSSQQGTETPGGPSRYRGKRPGAQTHQEILDLVEGLTAVVGRYGGESA